MSVINHTLSLTILVLFFCTNVFAEKLSDDHWEFVCTSPEETILGIIDCSMPQESEDSLRRINALMDCTKMPQIEIIQSLCLMDSLPEQKADLIITCIEKHFADVDEAEPNPVIKCIEDLPEFQSMMRGK